MRQATNRRKVLRNRAKCKKCQSIIESFHRHDYITCKCGEISVDGGNDYHKCSARDWDNFLRIDDDGNEIVPRIVEAQTPVPSDTPTSAAPTRTELLKMLDSIVASIEALPPNGQVASVSNLDLASSLLLIAAIFRSRASD